VRSDTAMTGEATLRGRVLPVGGIKNKVLAAHQRGIRRVILPAANAPDLDELPEEVRNQMSFVLADTMETVLEAALEPVAAAAPDTTGGEALHA
jgi:ATP-dependent Lon protease